MARSARCSPMAFSGKSAARAVTHVLSVTPGCGLQPPSSRCDRAQETEARLEAGVIGILGTGGQLS